MALITCPECGKKISDKAASCPDCGCPASEFKKPSVPEDTRSELDRIADEIFWNAPVDIIGCAKHLSKDTGISVREARQMMITRNSEWKKGKKSGKYSDSEYCPYCASCNIEYFHRPGIIVTRQSSAFKSMLISSQTDGIDMMRCQRCGSKWLPKRKKRRN